MGLPGSGSFLFVPPIKQPTIASDQCSLTVIVSHNTILAVPPAQSAVSRDSVPPSLLATALPVQSHDKVSDAEAKARADFDIRWKVALGIEVEDRPFAKSTLQVFRAHLILHGKVREVFESSLRLARESGYLKGRGMRVALDTTNILGRGAVKDTYNLLADGIVKLLRALAAVEQAPVREWAQARGYERYLGSSVKEVKGVAVKDGRGKGKPVRHSLHRTPTPAQQARWEAVQQARETALYLWAIARKLGMSRVAARKYALAERPPTKLLSAKAEAVAQSLMDAD